MSRAASREQSNGCQSQLHHSKFDVRYSTFDFLPPHHQPDLSNSSNLSDLSDPSSPQPYTPRSPRWSARGPAPGVISTERSEWRNLFRLLIARSPPTGPRTWGRRGNRTNVTSSAAHPLVTPTAPRTNCRRACCCLSEMPPVCRDQAQLLRGKSRGLLEIVIAGLLSLADATAENI